MEENKKYQAYYELQKELRNRVVHTDVLPPEIKYIAGTDVAYNDEDNTMIGAVVILDAYLNLLNLAPNQSGFPVPPTPTV